MVQLFGIKGSCIPRAGALAMLGYLRVCPFPAYTFYPTIPEQDINFE